MYTSFFGLNEKPFAITPDPRYLFMSERHGEGLAHLLYGVTDSGGFIQLTGEVGTGKTTLVRSLLGQLPSEVDVALILNPQVTVLEFLQGICQELGIDMPADRNSPMALVDALNRYLLDAHARGRRIILLVDEAQNLSESVLEQLRLLTNLETAKQKLLQIILIGQPELRDVLAQNNLRQLSQRVTGRYHLEPLSRDEAAQYIDHRLRVAGGLGEIFDRNAKREVHRLSGGIPRLMNVICDRALLGAYSREQRQVDKRLVKSAANEVSGESREGGGGGGGTALRWAAGIAALALAAAAGYGIANRAGTANMPGEEGSSGDIAAQAATADPSTTPAATAATDHESLAAPPGDTSADAVDLGQRLLDGGVDTSGPGAVANLLERWGLTVDPEGPEPCLQAEAAGLRCMRQRGSLSLIEQLDRPAVLTLTDPRGNTHDVVLQSLAGNTAVLDIGDARVSVPVEQVSEFWFGQYTVVWRPPANGGRAIMPGMRGPAVVWLRESLARIDGSEVENDDYFDAGLEARVREFQRQNRLQVDGLAGEQTQIIINSLVSDDGVPRLSSES